MSSLQPSPSPTVGTPPTDPTLPEDDTNDAEMPLTMAASVVLTSLPKNAQEALQGAGDLQQAKVNVRFHAIGSAPQLRQKVYKITSTQRFENVVVSLRKKLGVESGESVFCYVNQVFAPALDEVVGNLWRCFKTGDELVVAYAKMPAFG
ncbi:MAG: Ubiquitin-like protein [Chrysothrix sp. TS-e1954]|nr:MAG: Ubiquitin-like protein [Chrysothrix sp. TS-e1954]